MLEIVASDYSPISSMMRRMKNLQLTHAAVARPSVNTRSARGYAQTQPSLVIRSFPPRDGHPRVYAVAVGETGADTCVQSFEPPLAVCLDDPRVDGLEVCSGV